MKYKYKPGSKLGSAALAVAVSIPLLAIGAERQIEEIIVTAEKRQATVSDTSISITAFSEEMMEDMGIQSADEMINYIPATTRDEYDIRIRGIGRNYRSLGGDPGVATYYNGVYSEDFGIAATENALYDLERIEVLRGPQGTLYGRNSIGGAINYITRQPTFDWTGELRGQVGNYGQNEYYGAISGPLLEDVLAVRLVGSKRFRGGDQEGQAGSEDTNSIHDANVSIAFKWRPTDSIEANLRWNDRESDRIIGAGYLVDEGREGERGVRDTELYHAEMALVSADTPGAKAYIHPRTGETIYGAWALPGNGAGCWPCMPRASYHATGLALNSPNDIDDVQRMVWTNDENWEAFVHNATSFDITWDISDRTSIKYIYGYWDQMYKYDIDIDGSNSDFSDFRFLDAEGVYGWSHELQLLWAIGDNLEVTSGAYMYFSNRVQDWGMANKQAQGRLVNPVNYGAMLDWAGPMGPHRTEDNVSLQAINYGIWEGDPDGYYYHHINELENTSYALFTQGVYTINDNWSVTAGIRWAEDTKSAEESRGYYWEDTLAAGIDEATGFLFYDLYYSGYWQWLTGPDVWFAQTGLTDIGMENILMGNAYYGGPANPVVPMCALDDPDCATPLRLGGTPGSQWSHIFGEDTWSDVTYRLNIDWTPTDDTLIYFGVTKGYRSGGYALGVADGRDIPRDASGIPTGVENSLGAPFQYKPETVVAWELGYKSSWLDNTLQIFASYYTYDYKNYQDENSVWDPVRNEAITIVTNAEKAHNRGFEVEFTWLPADALTIGGNYSLTTAEYDSDYLVIGDDDPSVVPSLIGGVNANPDLFTVNVKGNQVKRIPKHKGVIWGSYRLHTAIGTIDLQATWSYTGDYDNGYKGRPEDEVPDRTQTDIGILWTDSRSEWKVRIFADNVFDELNLSGRGRGAETDNWASTASLLSPRYYGINIIRKFGQ